ncbi:MAG: hypothetical protein JO339_37400 [Alphaproteobacteria bacterium]|nr:hypothetical protein [Alphaproteobacteria bacterium]
MRMLSMTTLAAAAVLCGSALAMSSAKAQTPPANQPCGIETYSAADQKYVTVPCSGAAQQQQTQGQPANCGIETYSAADQKYVGVPCSAQVEKSSDGKESCGIETYSVAEQKYVGVPCSHK